MGHFGTIRRASQDRPHVQESCQTAAQTRLQVLSPGRVRWRWSMAESPKSEYEGIGLRAVRPYLTVSNADEAIDFYSRSIRGLGTRTPHDPSGRCRSRKTIKSARRALRSASTPMRVDRDVERLPRVGLRLYVTDVDDTYGRAMAAGATGDAPADRPEPRLTCGERLRSVRPHVVARGTTRVVGSGSQFQWLDCPSSPDVRPFVDWHRPSRHLEDARSLGPFVALSFRHRS